MEEWKDIVGFEGYYKVSNNGNIKNIKTGKILKGDTSTNYRRIFLYTPFCKKRFFIHRLVAFNFCEGYKKTL